MSKVASRAEDLFATLATQYYVAGRFSAMAGLVPVYGNLLHHAVECYLKAALARTLDLEQLARIYKHDLKRLWRDFKASGPGAASSLSRFDATIRALHRFERVRYPDRPVKNGMVTSTMGPGLGGATMVFGSPQPRVQAKHLPTYQVRVAEVDGLIIEGIWPSLFGERFVPGTLTLLSKDGRRALLLRNRPARKLLGRARTSVRSAPRPPPITDLDPPRAVGAGPRSAPSRRATRRDRVDDD